MSNDFDPYKDTFTGALRNLAEARLELAQEIAHTCKTAASLGISMLDAMRNFGYEIVQTTDGEILNIVDAIPYEPIAESELYEEYIHQKELTMKDPFTEHFFILVDKGRGFGFMGRQKGIDTAQVQAEYMCQNFAEFEVIPYNEALLEAVVQPYREIIENLRDYGGEILWYDD